jgi:hypothetical protein
MLLDLSNDINDKHLSIFRIIIECNIKAQSLISTKKKQVWKFKMKLKWTKKIKLKVKLDYKKYKKKSDQFKLRLK